MMETITEATLTCPQCGHQKKKTLRERVHQCGECGYTEPRDQAAARVMLQWAMKEVASTHVEDALIN